MCVVHDFAYGGIGFDGEKPLSFLQIDGAKETGIEIYTLSKTYNMAGWRVGFAAGMPLLSKPLSFIRITCLCHCLKQLKMQQQKHF